MAERSREMISEATRVLSVWKAIAMMSHISLRMLAQIFRQAVRGPVHFDQRRPGQFGFVLGGILAGAHLSTRFSTSRTLVR